MRLLTVYENIWDMMERVGVALNAPVFFVRGDHQGISMSLREFLQVQAKAGIHLAVPATPPDHWREEGRDQRNATHRAEVRRRDQAHDLVYADAFAAVGLAHMASRRTVSVLDPLSGSPLERFSEAQLASYLVPSPGKPHARGHLAERLREPHDTVTFLLSEALYSPDVKHREWHLGEPFTFKRGYGQRETTVHPVLPPGQYPLLPAGQGVPFWHFGSDRVLAQLHPTECIVCRGYRREGVMLAQMYFGPRWDLIGQICAGCLRQTTSQWLDLLGEMNAVYGEE